MRKNNYLIQHNINSDDRGIFAEVLRPEDLPNKSFGQMSFIKIKDSQTRGNHYHKIRYEYFTVIEGSVEFSLNNIKTGEKKIIVLTDKKIETLAIVPFWYHSLRALKDKQATVLIYSSIPYDPKNPDVYIKSK